MNEASNQPSTVTMPTPTARPPKKRKRALGLLFLLFVLAGAGWGAWWYTTLRGWQSTDDAYVAGNLIQIMPQISGRVEAVLADDTDRVQAGQALIRIDPVDARLALTHAEISLAEAVRDTRKRMAELRESEAMVNMRRIDVRQQTANLARREVLGRRNAVGQEELQHARDSLDSARHALAQAQEQYNALRATLLDTPLAEQPPVCLAAATVRERWLDLQRASVLSPVGGQVAQRRVQVGEYLTPGKPLMAVVPLDRLWVDANFKEGQLRNMRIGQPAQVTADIYGSTVQYHGRVNGLSAGTGSAFALLPPQNATGNWIKIVQRVPVRIELDPAELAAHPLLIGLSVVVRVDVADTSGPLIQTTPVTAPADSNLTLQAPTPDFAPVDARIQEIIQKNAQTRAPEISSAPASGSIS